MKLFLAGETPLAKLDGWVRDGIEITPTMLTDVIKRRLFSYYYHNDKGGSLDREVRESIRLGHDLFLDSGAYSAFTQGKSISVDEYAGFINRQGHHYGVRANLDDIGDDGPKSWENLKALESNGCQVFPVFHYSDKEEYLVKMIDNYEYMALGGLVGTSVQLLQHWLDHVWSKYLTHPDGTARIGVHGFGMTSLPLIHRYPWASVDSSSAVMTSIFGSCLFHVKGKMVKVDFSDESPTKRNIKSWHYKSLPDVDKAQVDKWIEPYGITAEQLGKHYSYRHVINFDTFQRIEEHHTTKKFKIQQPTLF